MNGVFKKTDKAYIIISCRAELYCSIGNNY